MLGPSRTTRASSHTIISDCDVRKLITHIVPERKKETKEEQFSIAHNFLEVVQVDLSGIRVQEKPLRWLVGQSTQLKRERHAATTQVNKPFTEVFDDKNICP